MVAKEDSLEASASVGLGKVVRGSLGELRRRAVLQKGSTVVTGFIRMYSLLELEYSNHNPFGLAAVRASRIAIASEEAASSAVGSHAIEGVAVRRP